MPKVLKIFGEVKLYSEWLFKFIPVAELCEEDAREAIIKPAGDLNVRYTDEAVDEIIKWTKGYPYFIQELCGMIWNCVNVKLIGEINVQEAIPQFLEHLDASFFNYIWGMIRIL